MSPRSPASLPAIARSARKPSPKLRTRDTATLVARGSILTLSVLSSPSHDSMALRLLPQLYPRQRSPSPVFPLAPTAPALDLPSLPPPSTSASLPSPPVSSTTPSSPFAPSSTSRPLPLPPSPLAVSSLPAVVPSSPPVKVKERELDTDLFIFASSITAAESFPDVTAIIEPTVACLETKPRRVIDLTQCVLEGKDVPFAKAPIMDTARGWMPLTQRLQNVLTYHEFKSYEEVSQYVGDLHICGLEAKKNIPYPINMTLCSLCKSLTMKDDKTLERHCNSRKHLTHLTKYVGHPLQPFRYKCPLCGHTCRRDGRANHKRKCAKKPLCERESEPERRLRVQRLARQRDLEYQRERELHEGEQRREREQMSRKKCRPEPDENQCQRQSRKRKADPHEDQDYEERPIKISRSSLMLPATGDWLAEYSYAPSSYAPDPSCTAAQMGTREEYPQPQLMMHQPAPSFAHPRHSQVAAAAPPPLGTQGQYTMYPDDLRSAAIQLRSHAGVPPLSSSESPVETESSCFQREPVVSHDFVFGDSAHTLPSDSTSTNMPPTQLVTHMQPHSALASSFRWNASTSSGNPSSGSLSGWQEPSIFESDLDPSLLQYALY